MRHYKTWHGAKRGAIAMARRQTNNCAVILTSFDESYFIVRPARGPWLTGNLGEQVCAMINYAGQTVSN